MRRPGAWGVARAATSAALLGLLLLNGACPYLGIKSEYSFTMFSNLDSAASNHLFLPHVDLTGGRRYYVVTALEVRAAPRPDHAVLLEDFLAELGHPGARGARPGAVPRPVLGDVLRYHLALLRRGGVPFAIAMTDAASGERVALSSEALPEEWTRYSVFMGYRAAIGSNEELHAVLSRYHDWRRTGRYEGAGSARPGGRRPGGGAGGDEG